MNFIMKPKIFITLLLISFTCLSFTVLVSWKPGRPAPDSKAIRASAIKGFSLLQTSGAIFTSKAKCASCHHNTMTSMAAASFKKKGITNVDTTATMRTMAMKNTLDFVGNPNLNNQFVTAKFLTSYVLLGLAADNYPADFTTDISVNYIM